MTDKQAGVRHTHARLHRGPERLLLPGLRTLGRGWPCDIRSSMKLMCPLESPYSEVAGI